MRITFRTILILLFISVLIMAYCSTTVDAGIITRSKSPRSLHRKPAKRITYKVKTKTKFKTKTKVRYGHKKPGLIKRIKHVG